MFSRSAALCLALAAAACVPPPEMVAERPEAPCRQVVPDRNTHIAWIGPAAARDRERLDRWCDAVGPAVVELTPARPSLPTDRLAILVWNAHVGGGNVEKLIQALTRGDLTAGVPVASFVLLLQEAFREGDGVPERPPAGSQGPVAILEHAPDHTRRSAVDIAHARGLAIVYVPSMRNAGLIDPHPDVEDRGNAILSTVALDDPMAIELPFERQRRVVVAAKASGRTTGGAAWRILLGNVHLDTSLAITRGGPLTARRRQAAAIIDSLGSWTGPAVLAGDFNTWLGRREAAVGDLLRAFPQSPAEGLGATWFGPLGTRAPLDHVFARHLGGTVAVRRVVDRFGSDHHPLLALVDLR